MPGSPETLKDLLLEDYRYRAEAMKSSEQAGETRFNIFVGLATLLLGALVTLSAREHAPGGHTLKLLVLAVLAVLAVLGLMTLLRLFIRNKHTDGCKRDLDRIRQTFKDHFDETGALIGYYPVGGPGIKSSSRRFGGLAHLMMAVNSLLLAALVACLLLPFDGSLSFWTIRTWEALVAALVTFLMAFALQWKYECRFEAEADAEHDARKITHAGGVVHKIVDGARHYLVIRPRQAGSADWVLPKGHIEKGEGHIEAALREVAEETSVAARPVCPLDVVEHASREGKIRVKYYLMEWLFDTPWRGAPAEGRAMQWLPFAQALAQLTHPESKHVLCLANHKCATSAAAGKSPPPTT
jgi:8-oxo-dGTP pyrophosphatase MutT (NUDIX family)